MRRWASLIGGIALGIGVGFLFLGLWRGGQNDVDATTQRGSVSANANLKVGSQTPSFALETLAGGELSLADVRGQAVILNFWATWCAPCRLEMPALQSRFEKFDGRLRVLAINADEPRSDVQAFVDELGLTFDVLLDPGAEIQQLYRIRGYPTSYFVDAEGVIRAIHIGLLTEEQLDGYLADLGFEN